MGKRTNELLKAIVENMNRPLALDIKCPHCGCQVYDPCTGKIPIHNIAKCSKNPILNHKTNKR